MKIFEQRKKRHNKTGRRTNEMRRQLNGGLQQVRRQLPIYRDAPWRGRNKYAKTCWRPPSCRHSSVCLPTVFCQCIWIRAHWWAKFVKHRTFLKQRLSPRWRTSFRDAAALCFKLTGLVRRSVKTSKGDKCFLIVEASHFADLGHELRYKDTSDTVHSHNNGVFWQ